MAFEPLAILRPAGDFSLPADLRGETFADLWLVSAPGAAGLPAFGLKARRRAVLRHAARRQAWLEALIPSGPVLPVRPGTALDRAGLAAHAGVFRSWLDRLENRVQLQLSVTWDHGAAPDHFLAEPELADAAAGDGLDRLARRLGAAMQAELAGLERDAIALPLAETGMLLNRVVLIDAGAEPALEAAVARMDAIWPEGLRLRLVGPSPAVSFALLGLRALPLSRLAAAAETLGLAPPQTGADLAGLGPALAAARRRALIEGPRRQDVPAAAATLAAALAASPPADRLPDPLLLPEVTRDGTAAPVQPSSLPPPVLPDLRNSA